jgi:CheY-like chemotaxis protein
MLESVLTGRIRLSYELEVDLWNVCLDSTALQDAILNISSNAMHAITDTGAFNITTQNISLMAEDVSQLNIKPGDYVMLSFADTGVGMNEKTQQKAFDPFFTSKGDSGTGLGLSQVYGFVQQSGGAIQVFSRPEQGTRMVIYLPRCFRSATDEPVLKTVGSSWDYAGYETILVVDDEGELCSLAKDYLSKHGYKVLCAHSGEKALEILETESVDLLFSDVIMPGMGGYELAARVKKNYPDIIIQMASGFSKLRHERKFDEKLHQQRLLKPYGSKVLLHRIRELLDRENVA